jgi:hypothetical protein
LEQSKILRTDYVNFFNENKKIGAAGDEKKKIFEFDGVCNVYNFFYGKMCKNKINCEIKTIHERFDYDYNFNF